jgi:uncharacterized protein (TIGR01244 family)
VIVRVHRSVLVLALAALAAPSVGAAEVPAAVEGVPNYHVVRPGLATAGQPAPEAWARLKELGFKTVINLRTEGEPGVKDEEKAVTSQGLRYVWVPLMPATLSAKDVDAVAAVLDDAGAGPVLLHCTVANRAGGLWAAVLARKGKSADEAEAEGVKAGLASDSMKQAVRRVTAPPSQEK